MKFSNLFLLLAVVGLGFSSCNREDSDSVDQDKIYVRYVLEYNSDLDITYARAQFRFSNATGTILELTDQASITFDGDALPWKSGLAYYEKEYAGLKASGSFSYTDVDGNTFVNSASVPGSIFFPASFDTVNINNAYDLIWDGAAIQTDEHVAVTIEGTNTTGSLQSWLNLIPGATNIILDANKLGNLGTGHAQCWMDRVVETDPAQATSRGGVVVGRYKAPSVSNIQFVN